MKALHRFSHSLTRRAFTLVEMLVVIAIIGILISLLLPALSRARESSRKLKCASNLKQVALAMQGYQEVNSSYYPPSVNFPTYDANDSGDWFRRRLYYKRDGEMFTKTDYTHNWVIAILPFLDLNSLYTEYHFRGLDSSGKHVDRNLTFTFTYDDNGEQVTESNYKVIGQDIPIMLCPSDNPTAEKFEFPGGDPDLKMARGNYAANAANGLFTLDTSWQPHTQGIMDTNRSLSTAQIHDGQSETMLLGEIRIGVHKNDQRGTWALGTPGASSLWGHGILPAGIPNPTIADAETIMYGDVVTTAMTAQWLIDRGMSLTNTSSNQQSVVRSAHPGGAHVAMCDGRVIFVADSIQSVPDIYAAGIEYEDRMGLWQRMISANDGLHADLADYNN